MAKLRNRYCFLSRLFVKSTVCEINDVFCLKIAWVADSGDDWSETEDDENSLTEFELAEEETVEEESHYTTDSSTTADVKVC